MSVVLPHLVAVPGSASVVNGDMANRHYYTTWLRSWSRPCCRQRQGESAVYWHVFSYRSKSSDDYPNRPTGDVASCSALNCIQTLNLNRADHGLTFVIFNEGQVFITRLATASAGALLQLGFSIAVLVVRVAQRRDQNGVVVEGRSTSSFPVMNEHNTLRHRGSTG